MFIAQKSLFPTPKNAINNAKIVNADALIELLTNIRQEQKWHGRRVNLSLDSTLCHLRPVIMPQLSKRELNKAMNLEAEKLFSINVDRSIISYTFVEEGTCNNKPAKRYLLAAAQRDIADSYTSLAVQAGFNPLSLETIPLTMLRALNSSYPLALFDDRAVEVLINFGYEKTTLLVAKEFQFLSHRTIAYGIINFLSEIQNKCGLDFTAAHKLLFSGKSLAEKGLLNPAAKLARLLEQSIEYCLAKNSHIRNNSCSSINVCGGAIFIPGLAALLKNSLRVKLMLYDPLAHLKFINNKTNSGFKNEHALFANAYSLALRGWRK